MLVVNPILFRRTVSAGMFLMASMNQHVLFSNITITLKVMPVYSVMWDSSSLNHNDTAKGGRELPTEIKIQSGWEFCPRDTLW